MKTRKMNDYVVVSTGSNSSDDYEYVHRQGAELKLGRKLNPGEVVHHVDGKKDNNTLENLEVMRSHADHGRFHSKNTVLIRRHEDGVVTVDTVPIVCGVCGDEFVPRSATQTICSKKCSDAHLAAIKPDTCTQHGLSTDQVRTLLWENPCTAVAKELGVSETAIRKYCKKHGIDKPGPGYWAKKAAELV